MTGASLDLHGLAEVLDSTGWDVNFSDGLVAVRSGAQGVVRLSADWSGRLLLTYTRQVGPEKEFNVMSGKSRFKGYSKIIEEISIAFVETDVAQAAHHVAHLFQTLREGIEAT